MFTVILIDHEEIIRKGLRKMIAWEKLGCEVVAEAEDGVEGFELIKEHVPDIIISAIGMPRKNGLEMIASMKDINQDAQIIILTGFREFEYAQQAISLGVLQFLLKPSNLPEITAAVEEAVENLRIQEKEKKEYNHIKKKVKNYYLKDTESLEKGPSKDSGGASEEEKPQFLVNGVITYIKQHYDQKINLQDVADSLYVSPWHLCRVLKKETATTFIDLLNSIRIEKAKELLVTTNLRIYEVAYKVGYSNTAYFSKIFRRFVEMTPNEYRNTQYYSVSGKMDSF